MDFDVFWIVRCIPKMDHHCPWTNNCVSQQTFPHFFRFLFYAVASMVYLEYFLFGRAAVIWAERDLPSVCLQRSAKIKVFCLSTFQYLGPTVAQMAFLFIFLVGNSIVLFALAILLIRNIWCLGANVTTIEGWEIERHEALVHRARKLGGYIDGPDGIRIRLQKQEFPYDIGIYENMVQGMGSNPLFWLWPFSPTPPIKFGLSFETNGLEGTVKLEFLRQR